MFGQRMRDSGIWSASAEEPSQTDEERQEAEEMARFQSLVDQAAAVEISRYHRQYFYLPPFSATAKKGGPEKKRKSWFFLTPKTTPKLSKQPALVVSV